MPRVSSHHHQRSPSCSCVQPPRSHHLGVQNLDVPLQLPPGIRKGSTTQQYAFLESVATHVVENFTVLGSAFTGEKVAETGNGVHNYARVLWCTGDGVFGWLA